MQAYNIVNAVQLVRLYIYGLEVFSLPKAFLLVLWKQKWDVKLYRQWLWVKVEVCNQAKNNWL